MNYPENASKLQESIVWWYVGHFESKQQKSIVLLYVAHLRRKTFFVNNCPLLLV